MSTSRIIGSRYELLELIDQGGMGKVYRGHDNATGATIAIKELKSDYASDAQAIARFAREAETLRKLDHPNIVKVLATVNEGDQHYIIMDFIGGGSLADLLRTQPRLPVRRALEIALPLADALITVHNAKIIHRDLKPENVLLAEDGMPRLSDFGVAQLGDRPQFTQSGALVGTFAYLSPEACRGEPLDRRTDIWSFGVLLYEMLAGRRPFDGNQPHVILAAILYSPVPPIAQLRPDLPEGLVELIGRMLTKDHDQRLPSVRLIGIALESLLQDDGLGTLAPPALHADSGATPAAGQTILFGQSIFDEASPVQPPALDPEEREHLRELLETHRRNLREYELQEALHGGIDVPIILKNELAHEREEIARLEAQLGIQRQNTPQLLPTTTLDQHPPSESDVTPAVAEDTQPRHGPDVPTATPPPGHAAAPHASIVPDSAARQDSDVFVGGETSRTVTFLFTDIEGSTGLWERNMQAMPRALARQEAILRESIGQYGGTVFKTLGDAFCIAFGRAADALGAALDAQRALLAESWGNIGTIRVRMALHTGDAELHNGDYIGLHVNRVGRVLAAGYGGQILLTGAVEELVRDNLPAGAALRDLGQHQLKDLSRPEQIFQVVAPDLPREFPPLKTVNLRRTNLKEQPSPLIGRSDDVRKAIECIKGQHARLLTLTGPGGIGKTRLSYQIAADLLEDFVDGVYVVSLAPIVDPALVAESITTVLGISEAPGQSVEASLAEFLATRQMLLVLDNFEHVLQAAGLVANLLDQCPRLNILVTSRERLNLQREQTLPVPPMEVPQPGLAVTFNALAECASVRLFVERALRLDPDFTVTRADALAIAEICVLLDGLPLAIELAAARIRSMNPQTMRQRIKDATGNPSLQFLVGGARDLPARQQTLRATIDWSYALLSPLERALFRRLTVFVGGRSLAAVAAVCDIDGDIPMVEDVLISLADKSLLREEASADGQAHYVFLKTLHAYGQQRLAESGEANRLRKRHAAYFLAQAETAEPELIGLDQERWLSALEQNGENLRAALNWFADQHESESLARLAAALWRFWYTHGHLSEGRHWLEQALALLGTTPLEDQRLVRAKVLNGAGALAWAQGDGASAEVHYEQSLTLFRELGDQAAIAALINRLGTIALEREDYDHANTCYTESLDLFQALGNDWGFASVLSNLGMVAQLRKQYQEAQRYYSQSLELRERLRDQRGIAIVHNNLAEVALCLADYAAAHKAYIESLRICRKLGDMDGVAYCLKGLGSLAGAQGQPVPAATLWGAAAKLRQDIGASLSPADRAAYEQELDAVRTGCEPAVWEAAFAAGSAMNAEQAIAFAIATDSAEGWAVDQEHK